MSSFLYQLGRVAARRAAVVIVVWLALLAVAGGGYALFATGTDDTFAIPGSEAQDALDHLGRVFPQVSGTPAQLVVLVPAGQRVDTPAVRAAVAAAVPRLERVPQVAAVVDPFGKDVQGTVSGDGRAALITVQVDAAQAEVTPATRDAVAAVAADLGTAAGPGTIVHTGGDAFSDKVPKLSLTEGLGVALALVVLLLVFRSIIAALMPLVTAVVGVGIAVATVYAATAFASVSSTAPLLAVMIGLAVGIDYALFLVSRHRDQLREGLAVEESIARATATAGSAVIFAGLTVIVALLGLAVAGIPFLTTMGVAAAGAVTVAVLIAVTLVPALLSVAGERLRPARRAASGRRPRGLQLRLRRRGTGPGLAQRWVRLVTRVPLLTVALVVAALAICALPATQLRLALPDNGTDEPGTASRTTYDVVEQHFGPGFTGPLVVTADVIGSSDPVGVVDAIAREIRALPGVASVPLATPNPDADTGIIQVVPASAPDSPATEDLVARLRGLESHFAATYGVATAVTGITAVGIDVSAQLGAALLPFGILVVGLSLVLLAMVFRSVAVPVKAAAGYLLSVGAAFGATSFVFQQGHLAGLFGVGHTGNVISFLPIILMGVLFGLAMDYEVFLVSRIREHYARHGDAQEAIRSGFGAASRVVVAAAVIMFAVFAAFVPDGSSTIKPIAFSLAVGVAVDAFLVRLTLVPAVLALLGDRAWWLPKWLDLRLPVFDAEGDGLMHELRLADWPEPGSTEVVSAAGLRVGDDRDHTVFAGVDLHLHPGQVLGVPEGSALLYTLAGRVMRIQGDLKVAGRVLPQHARSVRKRVALIACRDVDDPAAEAGRALDDGAALILLDDLDAVLTAERRAGLRDLLARVTAPGCPAAVVFTCHTLSRVDDLLPAQGFRSLDLAPRSLEMA